MPAQGPLLPNRVREYRLKRRMTLRALAKATGIDHGQLSKIETGQVGTSDGRKLRIARELGVSVGTLFFSLTVESLATKGAVA